MAEGLWNPRSSEHKAIFAGLLAPLVVASGSHGAKLFRGEDNSRDQVQAFILSLRDVPRDVLEAGVERLLAQGVTWMPRPGELREACAAVVAERRHAATLAAREVMATCQACSGPPECWVYVTDADGVERVRRCSCHSAGTTLVEAAGAPLALPPARVEDDREGAA